MIVPPDMICPSCDETMALLAAAGQPSADQLLLSAWMSTIIQAGASGACFVVAYTYFVRPNPDQDTLWTRFIILWSISLTAIQVFLSAYQNIKVEVWMLQLTAIQLDDFWWSQFSNLIFALVSFPIMMFLSMRAFNMWNKEDIVGVACVATTITAFACGITSAARGLTAPWGLGVKTIQEYAQIQEDYGETFNQFWPLLITSTAFSLASITCVSIFICSGLNRHRDTSPELDNAISRIIFVCAESLLPIFVLQATKLIAICIRSPTAMLIVRPVEQVSTAVFTYCFLLSLVSRQRVQHILSAEPVRNVGSFMNALQASADGDVEKARSAPAGLLVAELMDERRPSLVSLTEKSGERSKGKSTASGQSGASQNRDHQFSVSVTAPQPGSSSFAPIDLFLGTIPGGSPGSEGRMSRTAEGSARRARLFSTTGGVEEDAYRMGMDGLDERRRSSAALDFHEMLRSHPSDPRGR